MRGTDPNLSNAPKRSWAWLSAVVAYLSGRRGPRDAFADFRIAIATAFGAGIASLGAGYASSYVVPLPWPFVIGGGWFVMMANLDSVIVALIRDRTGKARWFGLGSRLPIAILGALIFTEVLMLAVFHPEITAKIAERQRTAITRARNEAEARRVAFTNQSNVGLDAAIRRQERTVADLQARIDQAEELRRTAGKQAVDATKERRVYYSREGEPYFDSTHSRAARAEERRRADEVARVRKDLDPEIARAREEIERLRSQRSAERERGERRFDTDLADAEGTPVVDGLMARIVAFGEICSEHPSAQFWRWILALFLFCVEVAATVIMFGERADAATIRERLHATLREALSSPKLKQWLALSLEARTVRYADAYMDDVDGAMGTRGPGDTVGDRSATPPDGGDGRPPHHVADSPDAESAQLGEEPRRDVTSGPSVAATPDGADKRVHRLVSEKLKRGANGAHAL